MTATGREAVLARIRSSLGRGSEDAARRKAVEDRLAETPKGIIPSRAHLPPDERIDLFCKMAEGVQASVERLDGAAEIPGAVAHYLRARNLPKQIRIGADHRLTSLDWTGRTPDLDVRSGRAQASDMATVSHALAGIAETGTRALSSGPDNPTTLNFLPEHHIAVVRASDIIGDMESLWPMIREIHGKGRMPRTVNFITGPSRSADIEQTLLLGAHGPRALHILIVS